MSTLQKSTGLMKYNWYFSLLCTVGFLVSTTLQVDTTKFYRENVLHLDYKGQLLGVLPFLGPGPRRFCVTYLPGDPELTDTTPTLGLPGWYVYMRDGHGGILGVRLTNCWEPCLRRNWIYEFIGTFPHRKIWGQASRF